MTNPEVKKYKFTFEKLFVGFYSFVFIFAAFSLITFALNREALKKVNDDEIQVNVITADEGTSPISTRNKIDEMIKNNTSDINPAVSDASVIDSINESFGRSNSSEHLIIIDKNGKLSSDFIQIDIGDIISFLNNSGKTISIKGGSGWGIESLENNKTYKQSFYPTKNFKYTVTPLNINGSILVDYPSSFAD